MSIAKRLLHGTLAGAASTGLVFVQQMALVPVLLSAWGQERYGVWLALQSVFTWSSAVAVGHQQYLNGELAKTMPVDAAAARTKLASALLVGQGLATIEWLLFLLLAVVNDYRLLGITEDVAGHDGLRLLLVVQATAHWLIKPAAGSLHKLLTAKPETHARSIWWTSFHSLALTVALLVFALSGAGLVGAAVGVAVALVVYAVPMMRDTRRRAAPYWPSPSHVDIRVGLRDLGRSLVVGGTFFVQYSLVNGINLLISGTAGAAALPLFTTTRTLANVLSQGVMMLVFPSTPELVRFEVTKAYDHFVQTLRVTWLVSGAAVNLGALALAVVVEPFYLLWTRGEMAFDRALFSYLALGVCLQALGLPLANLVVGMNHLRASATVALVKVATAASLSFALVAQMGTPAFGVGLAAAELLGTVAIPLHHFRNTLPTAVAASVWRGALVPCWTTAATCGCLLAQAQGAMVLPTSGLAAVLVAFLSWMQWRRLPDALRARARSMLPGPLR